MRLALVSQEYPPETAHGGIGTQTYLKAHGLAALGHDVYVVTRSPHNRRGEYREYLDGAVKVARISRYPIQIPMYSELVDWLTYSAGVAAAVSRLHERAPLDLVDFPEWACEAYVHLLNRTDLNSTPTVIQLHGPLVMFAHTIGWPALDSTFYEVGSRMEATCLRLADAVFSSSNCSAEWCAREYGLSRDRVPILHAGVDTRLFSPRGRSDLSRPTIVFVGRIAWNKGVDTLVQAACKVAGRHPGLHLRLLGLGDCGLVADLRAQAAEAGWPDLLELPGFVAREALPAELARAHVFAAPSLYEGGPGFVYLEAMACGLPVVACLGSGAEEAVTDGEDGLLVPTRDPEALAHALDRLLTDSNERERMGEHARKRVVETADTALCVRRLADFYQTVTNERAR